MKFILLYKMICGMLLMVVSISSFSTSYSEMSSTASEGQSVLRRKKDHKYYAGAREERFTFLARETMRSDKKIERRGLALIKPDARATIILLHGFMCNKHDIRFLADSLFSYHPLFNDNFNVVLGDFRAHGELSEGQCCSFGQNEKYDVMGLVDFIRTHPELKDTMRIVYGFSMGAVASILAQAEDSSLFHAAIWDCPFESTEGVIGRSLENLKVNFFGYEFGLPGLSLLKSYAYNPYVQSILKFALRILAKMDPTQINTCLMPIDTVQAAQRITIPAYFIACKHDEKSPVEAVHQIYESAAGYKRLWIANGEYHFGAYFYYPEKYVYRVRKFINKVLTGTIAKKPQQKISQDPPQQTELPVYSILK